MENQTKNINSLTNLGFKEVAYWLFQDDKLKLEIINNEVNLSRNILYCFVVDGIVKYIGKSSMGFDKRMNGYRNPAPSQSTNTRVGNIIKKCSQDKKVAIYLFQDMGLLSYGGFQLNLSAGLEDILIKTLQPEWNSSSK